MWQDYLFMVGGFIFSAALIPTILAKEKPTRSTSLLTSGTLITYCIAFASLGLYLAAVSIGINAVLWIVLLVQRLKR